VKRAYTRRPLPLPGTLARTPSAFGDALVSQMLTVAQSGRGPSWMRKAFFATLIDARSRRPCVTVFETGGTSAGITPGGNFGAASAPAGSRSPAAAPEAGAREAASTRRIVRAVKRRTKARLSTPCGPVFRRSLPFS
jgi:hypothetical protein